MIPADAQTRPARSKRMTSYLRAWARFSDNRSSLVGLAILVLFLAAALLAPVLSPYAPFELVGSRLTAPSSSHPFGTDQLGRDVFSGVLYGGRTSLTVGFVSVAMSLTLGLVIGAIAGFYGGVIDNLLMRITEVFQVLPRFFMALVIVAIFGADMWGTIFVIGILSWPDIARLVRSQFLSLRERPFVLAARAYGAGDAQLIFREVLPNALGPVIAAACLLAPGAILLEAGLSFIGAGDPSRMSWGRMLNEAQQYMRQAWWSAAFPGMAISVLTLSLALLGDGLQDAFDGRAGRRAKQ